MTKPNCGGNGKMAIENTSCGSGPRFGKCPGCDHPDCPNVCKTCGGDGVDPKWPNPRCPDCEALASQCKPKEDL